jgi:uncharacterized protein YgiM (DUF1202 family)
MGWVYYEMSGGADFVPAERQVAVVELEAPEIVTRADTTSLMSVSSSNTVAQPEVSDEEILRAVAQAVALNAVEPDVIAVVEAVVEPKLDIREVAGSRVNLRMGPGTGFDVITTLDGGTKIEVLTVDEDGWANVSTVDRGMEGWMAKRLLSDPET